MALLDYVLETPTYGWKDENGNLIKPTSAKRVLQKAEYFQNKKSLAALFQLDESGAAGAASGSFYF